MKKFIRAAIVLCMMLSLAVAAFAAPSDPSKTEEIDIKVTDAEGNVLEDIEFDETDVPILEIEEDDSEDFVFDDGTSVKVKDVSVVFKQDIHVSEKNLPVTIAFTVEGADADDVLHVLHHNGEKWERVGHGTGSTITVTFTSLSPVAVLLEHKDASAPAQTDPAQQPTSPHTGETPVLLVAAVVALLAGTVAVVTLKKKEEM